MNILGIDFEDWFHPELIQKYISNEKHEPKVVNGIGKILELLRKHETQATFFVVGELLESNPELLDLILENDHEIAFHTMKHTRIDSPNFKEQFENEILIFKKLTDNTSKGFRAPSFAPGLYHEGNGKDLGHVLEFKTEIQFSYRSSDDASFGISYNHVSNASLGDKNPGANSYMFNFLQKF